MDVNFQLSQLILEVLIRNGCRNFIFCPGARNSPLIRALFELKIKYKNIYIETHFDERGGAFYALGLAKSQYRPSAIITTSGTAVANLYPAIVEAFYSDVPLIAITADRPQRLHGISANQTIDQENFFHNFTRSGIMIHDYRELDPKAEKNLVDELKNVLIYLRQGPVHINCPFDEPLLSDSVISQNKKHLNKKTNSKVDTLSALLKENGKKHRLIVGSSRILSDFLITLKTTIRGLVVVGDLNQAYKKHDIFTLLESLMDKGWYVVCEIHSGMRQVLTEYFNHYGWGSGGDLLLENYALLLQKETFIQALNIDTILHIGGRLVDKSLSDFLKKCSAANYLHIDNRSHCYNPDNVVTRHYQIDPPLFCHIVTNALNGRWNNRIRLEVDRTLSSKVKNYRFRKIDMEMTRYISNYIYKELNELEITRSLARFSLQHLSGKNISLFIGNSMPIRDLNVMGARIGFNHVFSNRGVSGIDGLIATASGIAKGMAIKSSVHNKRFESKKLKRFYALIGDLSALHDINSLTLCHRIAKESPITLMVINNHEGTIFRHLPLSTVINRYLEQDKFYHQHRINFADFASAVNLQYRKLSRSQSLETTLKELHNDSDSYLLEIEVNSKINRDEHTRFYLDTMNHIDFLLNQHL